MPSGVEVRVQGRGHVRDDVATGNADQRAHCDMCGQDVDIVASTGPNGSGPFGCKACLRDRLEAMTLATWMLRSQTSAPAAETSGAAGGLPWGKVSG